MNLKRTKSIDPSFRYQQQYHYHYQHRSYHSQSGGRIDFSNFKLDRKTTEFKQRRLSCCCPQCGQFSKKMKKFHDVTKIIEPVVPSSPQNTTSLKAIFNKVAKKTKCCFTLRTVQSEKVENKIEFSPEPFQPQVRIKKIQLPTIKYNQIEDYKRKMHKLNYLIESTTQSCQLIRNSAPNLDRYETTCKDTPKSKREFSRTKNVYLIKPTLNGFSKFRDLKLIKQ